MSIVENDFVDAIEYLREAMKQNFEYTQRLEKRVEELEKEVKICRFF